jgi:signal transduction histidine kinase
VRQPSNRLKSASACWESERAARNLAERMSALKDEFLATLSHELRTPLSAILGWVHILRRGAKTPDDLQKGLDTIERNSRVQVELIDDLLDMNRIASGKVRLDMQPLAPITFIQAALETLRPTAEAKGVRLESVLDPSAGPVRGDPNRLQQVMSNLLSNAIKFTPRGGKVQVLLSRVNSHVEITVADSGMGIKPDFVAHVFERFRQADASTPASTAAWDWAWPSSRAWSSCMAAACMPPAPAKATARAFRCTCRCPWSRATARPRTASIRAARCRSHRLSMPWTCRA